MPQLTKQFLDQALENLEVPEQDLVFIESGTYQGHSTEVVCKEFNFKHVHSIEIQPSFHASVSARLGHLQNLTLHLGDTLHVLPKILSEQNTPLVLFLDGHFSHGGTGKGEKPCPLLEELRAIRDYPHQCLILVDDVNVFGSTSPNHVIEGWDQISVFKVLEQLNPSRLLTQYCLDSGLNRNVGEFAGDDRMIIVYDAQ